MSTAPANVQMDEDHSRAICAEIGERLRTALGDNPPLPPLLSRLMDKLRELDHHDSPSIVPSMQSAVPVLGSRIKKVANHICGDDG
jgi:hypothetical protein